MVKATELMIGNWVQIETAQARVIRLHEHFVDVLTERGTEIHITYQEVSPILVTKEIMEANGFEYNCPCYAYRKSKANPNLEMQWYQYEHRLRIYSFDDEDKSYYDYSKNHLLLYVHQLQNFLRNCNEFELADNFKIEQTMTDIEQRAKESFLKSKVHWTKEDAYVQGYKDCSNDQQEIDIEKACNWLKSNTPLGYWPDRMEEFKKAMEE